MNVNETFKRFAIQTKLIPTPSRDELGKIYQYVGPTTDNFKEGYFYKCVESQGVYSRKNVKVQDGDGASGDISDLDDVEITNPTDWQIMKFNETNGKWENKELFWRYKTVLKIRTPNTKKYAFFGDSITEGITKWLLRDSERGEQSTTIWRFTTKENYVNVFVKKAWGTLIWNFGVAGQSIVKSGSRNYLYDTLVLHLSECSQADIVFVASGINDYWDQPDFETFRTEVKKAFDYIVNNKSANTDIVILLPRNQNDYYTSSQGREIRDYRQIEYEEAMKRWFSTIDTSSYSPLKTNTSRTVTSIATLRVDGIHPSVWWYRAIGQKLAEEVLWLEYCYWGVGLWSYAMNNGPIFKWIRWISNTEQRPVFECQTRTLIPWETNETTFSYSDIDPYMDIMSWYRGFLWFNDWPQASPRYAVPYNNNNGEYYMLEFEEKSKTVNVKACNELLSTYTSRTSKVFAVTVEYIVNSKQLASDLS